MTSEYSSYLLFAVSLVALSGCSDKQSREVALPSNAASIVVESFNEIIAKSNCLACHQQGNQMGVPTWSEVSERYKGNKNAESFLINKISDGGSGSWGNMDMPPYYELSKTELKTIVQGILAHGPTKSAPVNPVKPQKALMQKK